MFATDMHIRDITDDKYIAELAHMLEAERADMLLLGGDYGESVDAAIRFLNAIRAEKFPMGIFGVVGNNDAEAFSDVDELRKAFPGRLLINSMCEVKLRGGRLMIGGLDEIKYGAYPDKSLFERANDTYSILLSHFPKIPTWISGARARLMLSGHTHGGQFRLFGLDPYTIGYEYGEVDAVRGITEKGGTRLLVSSGIGVSKLPLRIGCPPKIHLIDFA